MMTSERGTNKGSISDVDLESEILKLKRKMNAVILAHYYQDSEVQDLADSVGDSLELAKQAAVTTADVIVFCGVRFMAETAKILNIAKPVLLPDENAGCSLADGCPAPLFRLVRERHPDHLALTYINSSAEVKALSDILCTSSNAERILRQLPPEQPILFAPDQHLGRYLMKKTGRNLRLWQGTCIVHELFSERSLVQLKERHPQAMVLAHPECTEAVLRHANHVGSTTSLLQYAKQSFAKEFLVATEGGLLHPLAKACPDKVFIPVPGENGCACNACPHMRRNTLEKLYLCMRNRSPEITMDEKLRQAALRPILRMLEMS
jgi:quinolinate synthase